MRKCDSEHQHHRGVSIVTAYCRQGLMVEDAFIKLDSVVAKWLIGLWNSKGSGTAFICQARRVYHISFLLLLNKFGSLKQQFIISQFCRSEVGTVCLTQLVLCFRIHETKIKTLVGLHSWGSMGGAFPKDECSYSHSSCWLNSVGVVGRWSLFACLWLHECVLNRSLLYLYFLFYSFALISFLLLLWVSLLFLF